MQQKYTTCQLLSDNPPNLVEVRPADFDVVILEPESGKAHTGHLLLFEIEQDAPQAS